MRKKNKGPKAPKAKSELYVAGKMSTFGGPHDHGMSPTEGLALFDQNDLVDPKHADLFLPAPPPGTSGLGRRLNPAKYYLACRWIYEETPRAFLRETVLLIENPQTGKTAHARPVDWGPNITTGRIADLSPGLAGALGLNTDDDVVVKIVRGTKATRKAILAADGGHGSSNPHPRPPIAQFIESPNQSSRNGAKIDAVVLHCTEASLASTIKEFQTANGRQVSAHYVIDRNGDIYQMVRDSERANHCRGANQNTIGIEHVGGETDCIESKQAKASAALINWLIEQYEIPRSSIHGHDFTPGYDHTHGGTSCPDRLFGKTHDRESITAWLAANL